MVSKDEKALEALLSLAFREDFPEEISDEDAAKFFAEPLNLPSDIKKACDSWGTDFIGQLIRSRK